MIFFYFCSSNGSDWDNTEQHWWIYHHMTCRSDFGLRVCTAPATSELFGKILYSLCVFITFTGGSMEFILNRFWCKYCVTGKHVGVTDARLQMSSHNAPLCSKHPECSHPWLVIPGVADSFSLGLRRGQTPDALCLTMLQHPT